MPWTLVTGGAKGLGAEICNKLAQEGHDVVVHYKSSQTQAEEVVKACLQHGQKAESLHGDFSTLDGTERFIKNYLNKFSDTAYLINNVGNFLAKAVSETSFEEWQALFQNNLNTPFLLIKALLPSLKKNKGAIINLGVSGIEFLRADSHSPAYSCAKQALWMLTRSLAKELASDQVRVNMISPGYLENTVDVPDILPMGRLGKLCEATALVSFLLSEEGAYITGQNIEVAGGNRL